MTRETGAAMPPGPVSLSTAIFPGRNKDRVTDDDGWPIRGLVELSSTNQRLGICLIVFPVSQSRLPAPHGKQIAMELN